MPQLSDKPVPAYKPLVAFNDDTLAYAKYNFEVRKEAYINKPFSVLLKDLEIPIDIFYNALSAYRANTIFATTLEPKIGKGRYINNADKWIPIKIVIMWKEAIDSKPIYQAIHNDGNIWTEGISDLYREQIVGDVNVLIFWTK